MTTVPRVLSVEDDPGVFDLIKATLRSLPLELHHARNGLEALEKIAEVQPDLLVLDIALPDIHGWDVLKRVKAMNGRQPGVIVLTAHAEPAHRVIGRLQEVNAYVCKPFVPAELRDKVSLILGLA